MSEQQQPITDASVCVKLDRADTTLTVSPELTTLAVLGCELRVWEPNPEENDRGRMYDLDALGITVLIREREDGTFVHVDDDGETHPFTGPLLIEVRNGGEECYGEPQEVSWDG